MKDQTIKTSSCFVLMPFESGLINLWDAVIRPAIGLTGLTPLRADDLTAGSNIMEQIRRHILQANLVVAVITGKNPDVMYDLGLAHAAKKKVLLLQEKGEKLPQAFSHLHFLEYDPLDFPKSREALFKALATIQAEEAEDLFPELFIPSTKIMEEYRYLKQTRKTLRSCLAKVC